MLNGVLIVGVPMVALLAAAFYVFTRAQRDGDHHTCTGRDSARDGHFTDLMAGRPCSSNPRRRRRRVAGRGDGQGEGQAASASSDTPDSGFAEEDQCEICFENVVKVQLYPCQHSDICKECVHKILISSQRQCPFCRARIDGYSEQGSGNRYGLH
ncbi:hypothetical protein ACOMHN_055859 [Nucella lapillus]